MSRRSPHPSRPRSTTRSARSATPDVVVVGAGIVGLACAESLARTGLRVHVLDRDPALDGDSDAASWASAGMIAPLAEVPDDDRFLGVCLRSRDLWARWAPDLEEATGFDLDYDRSGAFLVADSASEPGRLDRFEAAARRAGEPAERVDAASVERLLPGIARDLDFGLRLPGEHRVDNRKVCLALRRRLDDLGVEVSKAEVEAVATGPGNLRLQTDAGDVSAGRILVAAGAWTHRIGGLPALPVSPLRGQMLRLASVDWPFQGCVRGSRFYAVRRLGGDLLVGATEDEAGFDCRVTAAGLAQLTGWLRRVFPGLAEHAVTEIWAGLRPSTPDGRPVLDQVDDGVWVAAGHHRNGILLAPWTAEAMTPWIAEGVQPEDRDLFSLARFRSAAALTASAPA